MGLSDQERERLTGIFYNHLAKYQPTTRVYSKRPTGDDLLELNHLHDMRNVANPWARLALELEDNDD